MTTLGKLSLAALALTLGGAAGQAHAAPSFQVIHTFNSADGAQPFGKIALDPKGVVYGSTYDGGANNCGTAWSLSPPVAPSPIWGLSTLHAFPCTPHETQNPLHGVVRTRNGTIYVGSTDRIVGIVPGTKAFSVVATVGDDLLASFDVGQQGTIYGVTKQGGTADRGSLFSVAPPAPAVPLYSFGKLKVGSVVPSDPNYVTVAADGAVYGTTNIHGGSNTIFRRVPGQADVTVLTTVPASYGSPVGVVPDNNGNLYGVTFADQGGSFFKLSPGGGLQVLHSFSGVEGKDPQATPMLAADGNLYGTMGDGGPKGCGVLYRLTPAGQYTVLHAFTGTGDGCHGASAPVQDKAGWLYGTTSNNNASGGFGLVFRYHL